MKLAGPQRLDDALQHNHSSNYCAPQHDLRWRIPGGARKTRQCGAGGPRKLRDMGGIRNFITLLHGNNNCYNSSGHVPQCRIYGL
jgi:hypothetical protein